MPVGMGAKVLVSVAMPPLKTRMGWVWLTLQEGVGVTDWPPYRDYCMRP